MRAEVSGALDGYLAPTTVEEAARALADGRGSVLAGGTDLMLQAGNGRTPYRGRLVNIRRVAGLRGVEADDGRLRIGALTTMTDLLRDALVREHAPVLRQVADKFASDQIRNMATVGGNLCNASPAGDTAPALIVHDASAVVRSAKAERRVPVAEFATGPGRTVLAKGEILTAVELPEPVAGTGSAFLKMSRVVADISQVAAAVSLVRDGDKVTDCRIALGAVAPTPIRVARAESALNGQRGTPEAFAEAAAIVAEDIKPITDVRASEGYRRQAARSIVRDALNTAWQRAAKGAEK